jgi:hypothetical protein
MKKLLLILSFFVLTNIVKAQDIAPIDTAYHSISTYTIKYYTKDSSAWIQKGPKYGTTKLISNRRAKFLIDSLALSGYSRIYIDSAFVAMHDTIDLVGTKTDLKAKIDTSTRAQPYGVATLDVNGKVPASQLGGSLLGAVNYKGTWSPVMDVPTLPAAAAGNKGDYYVATDSASYLGIVYINKDWIISNGTAWERVDNTNTIASVFGRVGNVVAMAGDYNTTKVTEGANLYYTDARARLALSLTNSGKTSYYDNTTGIINVAVPDSLTAYSYEYEIASNGETTKVMPFVIRDKTKIAYNGSTLREANWSGMYSSVLALNIPTLQADHVSIFSIGNWTPPSGFLLWKSVGGNIAPNNDGLSDSFWMIDAFGNITPIYAGTNNEFWKTDNDGNLTPS